MRRNHRFKMAPIGGSWNWKVILELSVILLVAISLQIQSVSAVCPPGCTCDDENLQVNCLDANIDFVPITLNPSVQKLILRNNRIRSVDNGFSFYPSLVHIDLSHNHLLKIQPHGFSVQTKLVQLNLSNNKVSSLGNQTFGGFGSGNREGLPALAVLNLHDNLLDTIEPGVFKYTRNLEELDLSKNALKVLNSSAFLGLSNLRILRLDNNQLTRVPSVFSAKSGSTELALLKDLFLGMNLITRIEGDTFSGLRNLATLDLKGCRLSTIELNAFRGLSALRKLILSDNELIDVPSAAFTAIPQLEILKLGRNPFSQIGSLAFGPLKKLKNLEMSGVPELQLIHPDAFVPNQDLESVEISMGKKLGVLPPKLFKGISSLRNLDLKENALAHLPEDLVSWQSLRHIRLEGNPFRCSCELLWLRDLLASHRFHNSSYLVLCSEPMKLRDRKVTSLSEKDMDCYLNSPIQKTILGVSIAFAVLFLIIFFFFMYRYHDRIKNTCKRKCFRNRRGSRASRGGTSGKGHRGSSSAAVKAAELNNTTKTSFLSHSSAYPYPDEEYAIRASLMSTSSPPNGGYPSAPHSMSYNPHSHSLQRGMPPPIPHMPIHGNYNMHSLSHQGGLGHGHGQGSHPSHYPSEYETPHINLGVGGLNLNYPQHYSSAPGMPQDHGMRYNPQQQLVKPIPITEL